MIRRSITNTTTNNLGFSVRRLLKVARDKAYLCTYTHTHIVTTKNISITKDAYDALQREKKGSESFTQTILRLTQRTGKLSDCFGAWNMTSEEEVAAKRELSRGWKKATERLVS